MLKFFLIIIFHFLWAETLGANNLLDLQFKGREESTKKWGMKLKIVAVWLKLCVAAVKPKSKYSLQGQCCSQPDKFWLFSLLSTNSFRGNIFHTNLSLVQNLAHLDSELRDLKK